MHSSRHYLTTICHFVTLPGRNRTADDRNSQIPFQIASGYSAEPTVRLLQACIPGTRTSLYPRQGALAILRSNRLTTSSNCSTYVARLLLSFYFLMPRRSLALTLEASLSAVCTATQPAKQPAKSLQPAAKTIQYTSVVAFSYLHQTPRKIH